MCLCVRVCDCAQGQQRGKKRAKQTPHHILCSLCCEEGGSKGDAQHFDVVCLVLLFRVKSKLVEGWDSETQRDGEKSSIMQG